MLNINTPEINADICVHSKILNPSCKECVRVCPNSAWNLNDNALSFDKDICQGCMICTSACPEGALLNNFNLKPINSQLGLTFFIACEKSQTTQNELKITCIHSLGLKELLKFYLNGVENISILISDCDNCDIKVDKSIFNYIEDIDKILNNKDKNLKLNNLNLKSWEKELKEAKSFHKTSLTRRSFMKRFTAQGVDTALKVTNMINENINNFTIANVMPKIESDILPFVVKIDENRCNGCDVCVKICQHSAIELDIKNLQYTLNSKFCTNCNLCMDMCQESAININKLKKQLIDNIELEEKSCTSCGIDFHIPKEFTNKSDKCQICKKIDHKKMLYQVID